MNASVLLVAQQLATTRSGVGLYTRILLEELSGRGRRVRVATWSDEIDEAAFPSAQFLDLGERPRWDRTPGGFVALGRRLAERRPAAGERPGLIHFTDAREAFGYLSRTSAVGRAPLIGTVHDDYAARAPRSPLGLVGRAADPFVRWAYYRWLRGVERRTYGELARVMVNSEATGASVAATYGVDAALQRVVHLCVAADARAPDAPRAPGLSGDPAILFAGGNFYRKGLDTLVRALPLVKADAPGACLFVAGQDRAERRIRRLAAQRGVADSVRFLGRLDRGRMSAAFAAADMFVMPSRTEALGLVYLEAMRAGAPVVSGDVGGVTEIVRDGESGLTVAPEDEVALAVAIVRLHGDGALRARLVAGGRAVLAERTPGRLADETLAVYDEVAAAGA